MVAPHSITIRVLGDQLAELSELRDIAESKGLTVLYFSTHKLAISRDKRVRLERVKGLLRSYEDAEAENVRTQGHRSISYQFLWGGLGISR